ncbi:uncharacterized mitochondrial protein-like protein [Tanacetum coccineum]|uniref:Uncharacterized mitochondrial protein-like protein n=1 Tax=Tanacetum coccineum TaxID=301880 RepID=A0ABQ4YAR4_9ASTR
MQLTKSMNYKPVVAGNQSNGNAGTKACDGAGKARIETILGKDYILLPLWTVDPPFSQILKSSPDAGFKPSGDDEKKVTKEPRKEGGDQSKEDESNDQEKDVSVNNTNNVNAASTNEVNVVGRKASIELIDEPNMPTLEDIVYSDDDEDVSAEADMNNLDAFMPVSSIPTTRVHKDHPVEQIIGDLNSAPQTRKMTKNLEEHGLFSSVQQRTNHKDFQNCLFACFLSQVEPKKMDIKSAFLYGKIEEEVYVCQPPGFEDPYFLDRVYKVEKALYRMHQAPKAWTASKAEGGRDFYQSRQDEDGEEVDVHLDRSMIGSLMYLTSSRPDIMFAVCACARYQVDPKVSHLHDVKRIFRYLKGLSKLGLWYPKDSPFDLVAYTDSDYARASLDKKSTIGGCQFLGSRLISWQCKKQTVVANSIIEAEYVAASSCCGQVLWIQNQLLDYRHNLLLLLKVNAARHNLLLLLKVNAARHNLLLLLKVNAARHKLTTAVETLVNGKKIIITEASVRRDLQLNDEEGMDCLPNATIFEELTKIGYEKLSQKLTFYKAFFSPQWKFLIHTNLQCLSAKTTTWNEFSSTMASAIICLATNQKFNFSKYIFESMVKNLENVSANPTDPHYTPIITQPSSSQPRRKQKSRRPKEKDTQAPQSSVPSDNTNVSDEAVNEEPSMQLKKLIDFCTKLQQRVPDLENTKTAQAKEIISLKLRVKRLEKKGGSRTYKLKRFYKIGRSARVVSSDEASLGDQEDASKQERKIDDIDADAEITLFDETQERHDDDLMFDIVTTTGEVVTTANVEVSTASLTVATITNVKGQGSKDKGKAKMIEPEKPLKKKDHIKFDVELSFKLQAEEDEEERPKVEADYQLAQRLQDQEQEELSDAEKATLCVQLLEKRRIHFAAKRVEEKRNKQPTKAQQRTFMCTYLKNMEGWKPKDLKNKSFANIQDLFDKVMKRVNKFVDIDTELVKESSKKAEAEIVQESRSKRAGEALEQESSKKQKVDDDKEIEELKQCMEIISDDGDDVTIEATPLSTKSPTIVDYKIYKEGKKSYSQINRADGNSQMYLTFGKMLKNFNKEDLEVLWSIVKARFKKTEPVNYMDTFLHLNLKTMFKHHLKDNVWKNQQGLVKVLNWKLYDSCRVHCVIMHNILYYRLVEKMYPLTKHTLHQMFNDVKLHVDYECEMAFELLRLVKK